MRRVVSMSEHKIFVQPKNFYAVETWKENGFVETSRSLAGCRSEDSFVGPKVCRTLKHVDNTAKSFHVLATILVLHNCFDDPAKLFSGLHLTKFLSVSAKPNFPCTRNSYMRESQINGSFTLIAIDVPNFFPS